MDKQVYPPLFMRIYHPCAVAFRCIELTWRGKVGQRRWGRCFSAKLQMCTFRPKAAEAPSFHTQVHRPMRQLSAFYLGYDMCKYWPENGFCSL